MYFKNVKCNSKYVVPKLWNVVRDREWSSEFSIDYTVHVYSRIWDTYLIRTAPDGVQTEWQSVSSDDASDGQLRNLSKNNASKTRIVFPTTQASLAWYMRSITCSKWHLHLQVYVEKTLFTPEHNVWKDISNSSWTHRWMLESWRGLKDFCLNSSIDSTEVWETLGSQEQISSTNF